MQSFYLTLHYGTTLYSTILSSKRLACHEVTTRCAWEQCSERNKASSLFFKASRPLPPSNSQPTCARQLEQITVHLFPPSQPFPFSLFSFLAPLYFDRWTTTINSGHNHAATC